jgi:hypothetical protein
MNNYVTDVESFYDLGTQSKYLISIYNAMLNLLGNEIYPSNDFQLLFNNLALLLGALINANIFGTIVVIVQGFNRKQ